jgi:uncharacterized surface protein with fasciclin (FAS1) repeats
MKEVNLLLQREQPVMSQQKRFQFIRSVAIATGVAGLTLTGVPVHAQTTPSTQQNTPGANTQQNAPGANQLETAPTNTPNAAPSPANPQIQTSNQYLTNLLRQVAGTTDSFDTLAQAVQAAGVTNALSSGQSYTIFAPTDEAFAELPQGTVQALLRPENRELLRQVLAYHVVPGRVNSGALSTGKVETLGGGIAVRVTPDRVVVNNGSVIRADIPAANGVVHVVNRVLLPSQLRQQLVNLQASNY